MPQVIEQIHAKRLVIFGEIHSNPYVIEFEKQISECMMQSTQGKLNIVFEHFNFEQQLLLEAYQSQKIDMDQLNEMYQMGPEGHDILAYRSILEQARDNADLVKLHAGFIPRQYARGVMNDDLGGVLSAAKEEDFIAQDEACLGSDEHYNYFESLISGRDMHDPSSEPSDRFRKMFPAQVIKDASMAHCVSKLLDSDTESKDSYLLLLGSGHMGYGFGVPERIFAARPDIQEQSYSIMTEEADSFVDLQNEESIQEIVEAFGSTISVADLGFVFAENDEQIIEESNSNDPEDVKSATAEAYDKVGETAHREGNMQKAHRIMTSLSYSEEEIKIAGEDAYNFQGVNCPHILAKIQAGETILDLGSGLGIDSFIAAERTGPTGKVFGLDISRKEVLHATKRAEARDLSEHVSFTKADMEKMPLEDNTIDCVISNGAFCLAPNKEKAFREILRVLKPGGRFSVSTTTMTAQINQSDGKQWPICMRMFIQQDAIQPMCEEMGFQEVFVDLSNWEMQFEESEVEQEQTNKERTKIHGNNPEFNHLQDYDMNAMCARVTVFGRKPAN